MQTLLTAKQIAERLNKSPKTIRAWFNEGKIPGTLLPDGTMRFDEKVIDSWLEKRTVKAKAFVG